MNHHRRVIVDKPTMARTVVALFVVMSFLGLAGSYAAVEDQMTVTLVSKTVTARVQRVYQMDPLDVGSSADFYWKVNIDGTWSPNSPVYQNQRDVILNPFWTFSKVVSYDPGAPMKLIVFELWDDDGVWDDRCDINRTGSRGGAQIWLDMSTGLWNGYDDRWPGDDVYFNLNGNQDGTGPYPDPDDNDCWMVFDTILS